MWNYEKRLQYPINITTPNAKAAQIIMSQYGGPDGEIGASLRYLSMRFAAPNRTCMAILTDVGTEAAEMFHISKSAKNPYFVSFLQDILCTDDKVLRYGENHQFEFPEHPAVVKRGENALSI